MCEVLSWVQSARFRKAHAPLSAHAGASRGPSARRALCVRARPSVQLRNYLLQPRLLPFRSTAALPAAEAGSLDARAEPAWDPVHGQPQMLDLREALGRGRVSPVLGEGGRPPLGRTSLLYGSYDPSHLCPTSPLLGEPPATLVHIGKVGAGRGRRGGLGGAERPAY